jgi:excisionase family DNA binding protein
MFTMPLAARPIVASMLSDGRPTLGSYTYQASEPPEVLDLEQAGELLKISAGVVRELAEAGKMPGRKLGGEWRFARAALLAWLGHTAA